MRTFRLAVLVTLSMATGVAFVDAGVRGGGGTVGGGHRGGGASGGSPGLSYSTPAQQAPAPSAPVAGGRHHGGSHAGGHAPSTTYHYGAWDFAPSDTRPVPEYRAPAVYNPVHINIEPVTFRREYSQRQVSRYWRRYFGNHYRYAKRRAMLLGTTAKILQIKDIDRKATPLRPLSTAAPKQARYSARCTSFAQVSSR